MKRMGLPFFVLVLLVFGRNMFNSIDLVSVLRDLLIVVILFFVVLFLLKAVFNSKVNVSLSKSLKYDDVVFEPVNHSKTKGKDSVFDDELVSGFLACRGKRLHSLDNYMIDDGVE